MKSKTTAVLLAVLLACVAYVVLRQTNWFRSPKELGEVRRVLAVAPAGVREVSIVAADGAKIALEKGDGRWRLAEPVQAPADAGQVGRLLYELAELRSLRRYAAGQKDADPSLTGLDKPRWTVTLVDEQRRAHVLRVGNLAPLSARETYVAAEGDGHAIVVEANLAELLSRPAGDYRDKAVFDFAASDVTGLSVEGAERSFELAKTGTGWRLVRPVAAATNAAEARRLVSELTDLRAVQFVQDRPSSLLEYELDRPRLLVTLRVQEPEVPPGATATATATAAMATTTATASAPARATREHVLVLGRRTGDQVYAKLADQPAVFKLNAAILTDLQPEPAALRQRQVLSFDRAGVVAVEVTARGAKAVLKKVQDRWEMTEPGPGLGNASEIDALLGRLGALQAEDFRDGVDAPALGRYGLDKPRADIALRLEKPDRTVRLLVGRESPSGQKTFIKPAEGTTVMVVPTEDADRLLSPPAAYRDTRMFEVPAGCRIARIAVQRKEAGYLLERQGDRWRMLLPVKADAEQEAVERIAKTLRDFRAGRIVALGGKLPEECQKPEEKFLLSVSFVPEPPASAPSSGPANPPAPQILSLAFRIHKVLGKVYVWQEGRKELLVGEFPPAFLEELKAEFRDRTVFRIDPAEIRRIKLLAEGESLELERLSSKDGDRWKSVSDSFVKIDRNKVQAYLGDLRELRAERFVPLSSGEEKKFLGSPWLVLELTTVKGQTHRLTVASQDRDGARPAGSSAVPGCFNVSAELLDRLAKKLKDFEPAPGPPT